MIQTNRIGRSSSKVNPDTSNFKICICKGKLHLNRFSKFRISLRLKNSKSQSWYFFWHFWHSKGHPTFIKAGNVKNVPRLFPVTTKQKIQEHFLEENLKIQTLSEIFIDNGQKSMIFFLGKITKVKFTDRCCLAGSYYTLPLQVFMSN